MSKIHRTTQDEISDMVNYLRTFFKLVIKKKGVVRLNNTETINCVELMVKSINRKINVASMMLQDVSWKNLPTDIQRTYQGLEKALKPLRNSNEKSYSSKPTNQLERMTS